LLLGLALQLHLGLLDVEAFLNRKGFAVENAEGALTGAENFLLDAFGAAGFAFGLALPAVAGASGRQLKGSAARSVLALRRLVCDGPACQLGVNRSDPALGGIELLSGIGVGSPPSSFEQPPALVGGR